MGRVIYDSKRLIPAPFASINKQYQRSKDGSVIGSIFSITLIGKIVAYKGSPSSSGTFWTVGGYPADESIATDSRLGAVLRKQDAIRNLFNTDGKTLEIQSADGTEPLKCNPRVIDVDFSDDLWHDLCDYRITLEADRIYPENEDAGLTDLITNAEESWTFETDESQAEDLNHPRTYRLSHTISADGKRFFDETGTLTQQAWKNARDFVLPRLGIESYFISSSGVNNLPSYYGGYNHVRSQNTDELGGSFSVTENWILASGAALEDFTVDKTTNLDSNTRVVINGSIQGLEVRNSNMELTSSKYFNADAKFSGIYNSIFTRAQNYSNTVLNIQPISTSVGKNPIAGTINYSHEYDNRPSNLVSGARSELIVVTENDFSNIFAAIPVLGRARGPVLQNIGTSDALSRGLSIELVMEPVTLDGTSISTLQAGLLTANPRKNPATSGTIINIINAVDPINGGATKSFKSQPQETWEPKTGRYTYNINWTFE